MPKNDVKRQKNMTDFGSRFWNIPIGNIHVQKEEQSFDHKHREQYEQGSAQKWRCPIQVISVAVVIGACMSETTAHSTF